MRILTLDDFVHICEIEKKYFPDGITSPEDCFMLYQKNKDYIVTLEENDNIIGFYEIIPLKKNIYYKVKNGELNEKDITAKHMKPDDYSYLYLSSVAFHPEHKSTGNILKLMKLFKEQIGKLAKNGTVIKEVMADCLTDDGCKICTNILKLKFVANTPHNSNIYCLDGETFIKNLIDGGASK